MGSPHYETVITKSRSRYFHCKCDRKTTNSQVTAGSLCESPQFLRSCNLQSWCQSMSQNGPYFPFGQADWSRVCFEPQLAPLRKSRLLKDWDDASPEPVLAMRARPGWVMMSWCSVEKKSNRWLGNHWADLFILVQNDLATLDNAHKLSRCGGKT